MNVSLQLTKSFTFCDFYRLKKRLNKVTEVKFGSQESGLNRIGVAAFPNTNKNAVEGANPVYNEEKKMPDFDDSR